MNANNSEPDQNIADEIDGMEAQAKSGSAAPMAIAITSVVVVALLLAAWFFGIAPARRNAATPGAQTQQQNGAPAKAPQSADEYGTGSGGSGAGGAAGPAPGKGSEKTGGESSKTVAQPDGKPLAPSFDTVRVESSGDAVLAGQAAPGAKVYLFAGDNKIGEAVADPGGNWALVLDKPLPAGTSDLWISADKAGAAKIRSEQTVAIVIDPDKRAQPLVVVQDGRGSGVLQQPDEDGAQVGKPVQTAMQGNGEPGAPAGGASIASDAQAPSARAEVKIAAADYADDGKLHISGGAQPGATVRVYYDDAHAGDALADANGSWSLSIAKDLDGAVHAVRADDLKAADGSVQGRAEVSFIAKLSPEQERELSLRVAARADQADQAGRAQSMAAQGERAGDGAVPRTATEPSVGQGKTAMASGSVGDAAPGAGGRGRITVERGDNLWRIARENYGAGIRYTAIFRANKDQIRNPHLIYPGQVFLMPRLQDSK